MIQFHNEILSQNIAVSYFDYETETSYSVRGDQWFHAASTIKVGILTAVLAVTEEERISLDTPIEISNKFHSIVNKKTYRLTKRRDADKEVYKQIGKTMTIKELAHHMIIRSSNLATNILIDAIGVEKLQNKLASLNINGVDIKRGVEDERAYEAGINNRVTANGLTHLLRSLCEQEWLSEESCNLMLDILFQQEFNSGIPAGLPSEVRSLARIAHKTGEISTVTHDTGIVFIKNRQPYVITILTQHKPQISGRHKIIASISQTIYENFINTGH